MLKKIDPRYYQLIAQTFLLAHATLVLGYEFFWPGAFALGLSGVFTARALGRSNLVNLSFFNTTLSGLILMRSENLWIWMLIGFFAMLAKILAKERGQHIFNPSNFAVVIALLVFDDVWVDPGLWAQDKFLIFFCVLSGLFVNSLAKVWVASLSFLTTIIFFELSRSLGLGDPLSLTFHNLQNGGLFVFAFFTLTDPKTAPRHFASQFLYGLLLSALSFSLKYSLFVRGAWFYALFLVNILTPIIHYLLPILGEKSWKRFQYS